MSAFYAKDHSNFKDIPMEQVIYQIDTHIEKTLGISEKTFKDTKGRTQSMVSYRQMKKYELIFLVAENLPNEVKLMKDYICQTTSNILTDIEKIVDIPVYQDTLTKEFTKKGNLWDYKSFPIPACKKKLTLNEAKVKEDKKDDKKLSMK